MNTVVGTTTRTMYTAIAMTDWDKLSNGNKPINYRSVAEVLFEYGDLDHKSECIQFAINSWKEDNPDKDFRYHLNEIGPVLICTNISAVAMLEFNKNLTQLTKNEDDAIFEFEQRLITRVFALILERMGEKTLQESDVTALEILSCMILPLIDELYDELFEIQHKTDKRTDLICRFRVRTNMNWEELCDFVIRTYNGKNYNNFSSLMNNELILKIPRVSKYDALEQNLKTHDCEYCDNECNYQYLCSGCGDTNYCSKKCFKSHWKTHKKDCTGQNNTLKAKIRMKKEEIETRVYASLLQQNLSFLREFIKEGRIYQVIGTQKNCGEKDFILYETSFEKFKDINGGDEGAERCERIKKHWEYCIENDEMKTNFIFYSLDGDSRYTLGQNRKGMNNGIFYVAPFNDKMFHAIEQRVEDLTKVETLQSKSMEQYTIDYQSGAWKGLICEGKYFVKEKFRSIQSPDDIPIHEQTVDFQINMSKIYELEYIKDNHKKYLDKMVSTLISMSHLAGELRGKFNFDFNTEVGQKIAKIQTHYSHSKDDADAKTLLDFKVKKKQKQNDKCACGSGKKFKKCCGKN
tara:strand:- start:1870 stop:3597 length:1728 start_codon:yes stop_codon:yes gene_type:complete